MNRSSSLKPVVYVEYKWPRVFKPELIHSTSQSPSWGNPSSAPPSRAAQNLSQPWCNDVSVPLTYLSIMQWGLRGVIKIAHLICPLLLSYSEEVGIKSKDWASQCRFLLFLISSKITNPLEIHTWDPGGSAAGMMDTAPWMILDRDHLLKGKSAMAVLPI